jgi:hypothetical protein
MPHRLNTHVLTVDVNAIYKVDTGYPANVCNMRTGKLISEGSSPHMLTSQSRCNQKSSIGHNGR